VGGAFLQGGKKFAAQISLLLNYATQEVVGKFQKNVIILNAPIAETNSIT